MSKKKVSGRPLPGEVVLSFTQSLNTRPVDDGLRTEDKQEVIVTSRFDSPGGKLSERCLREAELRTLYESCSDPTVDRRFLKVDLRF